MLAASSFYSQRAETPTIQNSYHKRGFLPKTPSPLSPCSANIHGNSQQAIFGGMSANENKPSYATAAPMPFANRAIKKAPVVSQDALKERRRGMFLKKVKEGREDRRFERHGEDIMRLDFVQRQKRWEAEQARAAPMTLSDAPEEEEDDDECSQMVFNGDASQLSISQWQATPEEADQIAQMEDQELEALLSFLPGEDSAQNGYQAGQTQTQTQQGYEQMSEHFGSDDDDFDALFSDLAHAEANETGGQAQAPVSSGDAMDMS